VGIYGYAWEPHEVLTEDGFHLSLMEITGKISYADDGTKIVTPSTGENGPLLI